MPTNLIIFETYETIQIYLLFFVLIGPAVDIGWEWNNNRVGIIPNESSSEWCSQLTRQKEKSMLQSLNTKLAGNIQINFSH